ncbi:MAG: DEAD/DEAH box helicase, partial [Pseudomonadota bacterium]
NPAIQAQATDRAYRIGQTRPVFAYNLVVAGSVEERIMRWTEPKPSERDGGRSRVQRHQEGLTSSLRVRQ